MTAIGVAESFYGEMRGNEGRLTAQHLIVRKADGELWVGSYGKDDSGRAIPQYERRLSPGDERFTVPLAQPVEIQEPSVLITYGKKFLTLLEDSKAFPELVSRFQALPRVSKNYYEEFRGYVGTQKELEDTKGRISLLSRMRLEAFFNVGDLSDVESLDNFYRLWKGATVGIFATTENLALDTACRIVTVGEEKRDYDSWLKIHSKHHEAADYQETLRLLRRLLPLEEQ